VTIFGFNTDVRHGDTVFHVQTEAQPNELTVRSAIFVRGRCIGKHSASYAGEANLPEFDEQYVHELVTQQHRFVLNTIREGRLESLLAAASIADVAEPSLVAAPAPALVPLPSQAVASCSHSTTQVEPPLTVEWLPDSLIWQREIVRIRFRIASGAQAVEGARILTRLESSAGAPIYCEGISDARGETELVYRVPSRAQATDAHCTVLAKVISGDTSVIRKFRLQRS
jgi:hypothetical protein